MLKDKILDLIINTDWKKEVNKDSVCGHGSLAKWRIYKYIKEKIPEIE